MSKSFAKDPDAVLDYQVDWSGWLGDDTIATSTWIVPEGISKDSAVHTTKAATIWLSGGTLGVRYHLVNRIETAGGRTDDRVIDIVVMDR